MSDDLPSLPFHVENDRLMICAEGNIRPHNHVEESQFPYGLIPPQGYYPTFVQLFILDHQQSLLEQLPRELRNQVTLPPNLQQALPILAGITQPGMPHGEHGRPTGLGVTQTDSEAFAKESGHTATSPSEALVQEVDDTPSVLPNTRSYAVPLVEDRNAQPPKITAQDRRTSSVPDSRSGHPTFALRGRARILCFDAGGVRCLSSLLMLKYIMAGLCEELGQSDLRPCDVFDLIGGTSMGGIIAIMLGHFKMSVDEALHYSKKLFGSVFLRKKTGVRRTMAVLRGEGRYSSVSLSLNLDQLAEEMSGDKRQRFLAGDQSSCKTFVTLFSSNTQRIKVVRNYSLTEHQSTDLASVDIMRACVASPTYFDAVDMAGETYLDGSMGGSNPGAFALEEANALWDIDLDDIGAFVSLGTGIPKLHAFQSGSFGSSMSLVKTLVHIAQDSESEHERLLAAFKRSRNSAAYYRFNVSQGLADIAVDEYASTEPIFAFTQRYLDEGLTSSQMNECVQSLTSRHMSSWINSPEGNDWISRIPQIRRIMQGRERRIVERIEENSRQSNQLEVELVEARSMLDRLAVAQEEDGVATNL
ncbi:FabD/lysophospholipase-like protein [Lentithecium fluviatile CBS 122367]|uniref:FabD/lysophospholipase-like protein n=1 Tax=Lentithecium fluviatile CBS 122367 TaxID=1168545 RepID=A0A6G1IBK1_9PLEO|nr:FabD/lysophospholipase-like protein [Lentithecium fluviatile CBS 122367]